MDGVLKIPLKSSGYSFRAGYNLTDSHPAVGYHLFSPPGFATPHKRGWFRPSYCYRQIECSEQRVDFPVGFQLSSLRSIIDLPGRDRFHETDAGHLPDPRPFSRAPSTLLGNRSISNFDGSAGSSDENTRLEISTPPTVTRPQSRATAIEWSQIHQFERKSSLCSGQRGRSDQVFGPIGPLGLY